MNTPNSVNVYVFALCLPKQDIASVIAGCCYALRESISLVDSLKKLGFNSIDTQFVQDVSSDRDLTSLASHCTDRLIVEKSYESVIEPLPIGKPMNFKVGDAIKDKQFPNAFLALIDDRKFRKTGNSNDLWLEIKIGDGQYAIGSLGILRELGWKI